LKTFGRAHGAFSSASPATGERKRPKPDHPRYPVHHLTEAEIIRIIVMHEPLHIPKDQLTTQLGIPESTVKSVLKSRDRFHTILPKRGRPRLFINLETEQQAINELREGRHLTLRKRDELFDAI
jgi:hypothetical protein